MDIIYSLVPLFQVINEKKHFKWFQNGLTIVFTFNLLKHLFSTLAYIANFGIIGSIQLLYRERAAKIVKLCFILLRKIVPSADKLIQTQINDSIKMIQKGVLPGDHHQIVYEKLPICGLSESKVRTEIARYKTMDDTIWQEGKVSGTVYTNNEELIGVVSEAFSVFALSNPLHPQLFQSTRQMESEIIAIILSLFNGPVGGCGNITSGGTESLLMAIKAYRDLAYDKKNITEPEIVAPATVHVAVNKACAYFKIKLNLIPIDPLTGQVVIKEVRRFINGNTICLIGSAPNYPHGIIDDIPALSSLAIRFNLPLHIDACLGGFLLPFMEKAGFPLPYPVDFRQKGVTSISVDTHKYGFTPKGSSVIMYRNADIRKHQYFVATEWPGGVYASPTIAGSRPGALVATCWATLMYMGESGYVTSTKSIITTTSQIKNEISKIPELKLIGNPIMSVVAFQSNSKSISIFGLADLMAERKWQLNILQFPAAIHICVTLSTIQSVDRLIQDMKESLEILKKDPSKGKSQVTAIYGSAAAIPDRSLLEDVAGGYLDGTIHY